MAMNTEREFLTAVLAIENLPDEVKETATSRLAKLDERNEKRKNTLSKEQKENLAVMERILEYLTGNGSAIASEIAQALEISTQKASSLCRKLVEQGTVTVADIKSKKGTVKQYTAVVTTTAE